MRFDAYVEDYIVRRGVKATTAEFYRGPARMFQRWNKHPLSLYNAAVRCEEFCAHIRKKKIGPSRQMGIFKALRVMFRDAVKHGLLETMPSIPSVRVPEHQPDGFTDDELNLLLKFADPWQKAVIMLAYDTGLRKGDLLRLRWDQVEENGNDDNVIRLVANKTGRHKPAWVSDATLAACRALKPHLEKAKARIWSRGMFGNASMPCKKTVPRHIINKIVPYPYAAVKWRNDWRKLGERAGVDVHGRILQCIRRTGASRIMRDRGILDASNYLGHSGINTALKFYRVPHIVDATPPRPPALISRPTVAARSG